MPESVLQLDPATTSSSLSHHWQSEPLSASGAHPAPSRRPFPAKHKLALVDLKPGDLVLMYGMVVGEAIEPIPRGGLLSTRNIRHRAGDYTAARHPASFAAARCIALGRSYLHGLSSRRRPGGHAQLLARAAPGLLREPQRRAHARGPRRGAGLRQRAQQLSPACPQSCRTQSQRQRQWQPTTIAHAHAERVFPNIDGIRFLTHQGGCGGTRQDAQALCGLLAGYIHHPNVAGATVLSLGCQNAQATMLLDELRARDPEMTKPVLIFDQQRSGRETALMTGALDATFAALVEANELRARRRRSPRSPSALKCGGSDGFSGISANPTLGYVSDLLGELGGKTMLSEFPELHGVEQELINRCATDELAQRFSDLMQAYCRARQGRAVRL